jgi:hypothetical protein
MHWGYTGLPVLASEVDHYIQLVEPSNRRACIQCCDALYDDSSLKIWAGLFQLLFRMSSNNSSKFTDTGGYLTRFRETVLIVVLGV